MGNTKYRAKPPECHPDRKHFSNGMCKACYQRHWRTVINPTYYESVNAKVKYGLTLEEHRKLLAKGTCDICGEVPKKGKIRNLVIDHDHTANKVRGVLCRKCNSNLGWLENRKNIIEAYLNKGEP